MPLRTWTAVAVFASSLSWAQAQGPPDPVRHIDALSAFDYPTRMNAARMLRRVPTAEAVPLLDEAVRSHRDEFVRYRALVVLTSFNDRGMPDRMRALMGDRNDRVREVAYRWLERNPDPRMAPQLRAALETEAAEFVRPALVRALAALPPDDSVQRALVGDIGRGFDFFRSAVIEALGEYRATYAVDAIAAVAAIEGPLQDDAVLALGRIGDRRALPVLSTLTNTAPAVTAALQASQCLLGDGCAARIEWLETTARSATTRAETVRAAVAALGAIAQREPEARMTVLGLSDGPERLRFEAALALSGVALRDPAGMVEWLGQIPDAQRSTAVDLLREGFEALEEDFAEEQFFAVARAAYWSAAEESATRTIVATLIDRLEF